MKSKILISIIIFLFLSVSLFSQNKRDRDVKISKDESGYTTKESTQYQYAKAVSKIIYLYDPSEKLVERTTYLSEYGTKWIPAQKYRYEYTRDGKIANIIQTKWNQEQKMWARKSQCIAHSYGSKGTVIRQITIDTNNDKLLTMKE